jgi:hypothetical protein
MLLSVAPSSITGSANFHKAAVAQGREENIHQEGHEGHEGSELVL